MRRFKSVMKGLPRFLFRRLTQVVGVLLSPPVFLSLGGERMKVSDKVKRTCFISVTVYTIVCAAIFIVMSFNAWARSLVKEEPKVASTFVYNMHMYIEYAGKVVHDVNCLNPICQRALILNKE